METLFLWRESVLGLPKSASDSWTESGRYEDERMEELENVKWE